MPLTKVTFRPGINKETTTYSNEGGFYNCDKVRFRTGYPEKIGGYANYSPNYTFNGVARSLCNWVTYDNNNLTAFGTTQRYYIENGGIYYDITPIQSTGASLYGLLVQFGSFLIFVGDTAHGQNTGNFVQFTVPGGSITLSTGDPSSIVITSGQLFEIVNIIDANSYYIIYPSIANQTNAIDNPNVTATYFIPSSVALYQSASGGWGSGGWGEGSWGYSATSLGAGQGIWSQVNYNQDLIFAQRNGSIYYWTKDTGEYSPGVTLASVANSTPKYTSTLASPSSTGQAYLNLNNVELIDPGAFVTGTGVAVGTYVSLSWNGGLAVLLSQSLIGNTDTGNYNFSYAGNTSPTTTLQVISASTYQFIIAMGSTPYNPTDFNPEFNPMLVRWSDQSNALEWTPTTYNQAGEQLLSSGSFIVGSINTRQEELIWTNTNLYSMQYIGAPYVWGFTSLMDNISIMSQYAMVTASGITYWMGVDKFYVYSGIVSTLPCTLRKFVFNNLNKTQGYQVVAGVNEEFNEIWWFYPSLNATINDSYVIYNYLEQTWYYGSLSRSAWLDSPLRSYPMGMFSIRQSYLAQIITATQTYIPLIDGSTYPASGSVYIGPINIFTPGQVVNYSLCEQITYTGVSGNTLTGCTRSVNGVTAPGSYGPYNPVYYGIPNQIINHEFGVDDYTQANGKTATAITSYLESSDFEIADGDHYAFVWRALPDFAFAGSTSASPQVLLTLKPRQNVGTAYQVNVDQPAVTSTNTYPVELFTGEVFTRVRGREMAFRIDCVNPGVQWQLGTMRFDFRPDGRR